MFAFGCGLQILACVGLVELLEAWGIEYDRTGEKTPQNGSTGREKGIVGHIWILVPDPYRALCKIVGGERYKINIDHEPFIVVLW